MITAGTAIRESMAIIQENNAELAGVLIALDRQERGTGALSAIQQVETEFGAKVVSIVTLNDVVQVLQEQGQLDVVSAIRNYQAEYGIAS